MTFQGYKLASELDEGLRKYGEENNLSPSFILNDLVESFLVDKGYLGVKSCVEDVEVAPEKIKYAPFDKRDKRYVIRKRVNGKCCTYASVNQGKGLVKEIIQFLESKNWDTKYTTKSTGLKGVEQVNFLLKEMEKERFL